MDLQLLGKTAYVTGGAQGIGAAIAQRLFDEGVTVAVADIDEHELRRSGMHWSAAGREPELIAADLSDPVQVRTAAERVCNHFNGPPDILVNNVGTALSRRFVDIDDSAWTATFELNFMSYVRTSRFLVPLMAERGGAVVNVASDLAKQPESIPADYGCMKAAILYLSKALAQDYGPSVRVNTVCPGPIWTGLWSRPGGVVDRLAEVYATDRDEALKRYLADRQLTFGIGEPDDVAWLVAFLVSPNAARISGSTFDVGATVRSLF